MSEIDSDDQEHIYHVYPPWGRTHDPSPDCWCKPVQDDVQPAVLIHNIEN